MIDLSDCVLEFLISKKLRTFLVKEGTVSFMVDSF